MDQSIEQLKYHRDSGHKLEFKPIKLLNLKAILELLDEGFDVRPAHDYDYGEIESVLSDPRIIKLIPLLPPTLEVKVPTTLNHEVFSLLMKNVNVIFTPVMVESDSDITTYLKNSFLYSPLSVPVLSENLTMINYLKSKEEPYHIVNLEDKSEEKEEPYHMVESSWNPASGYQAVRRVVRESTNNTTKN